MHTSILTFWTEILLHIGHLIKNYCVTQIHSSTNEVFDRHRISQPVKCYDFEHTYTHKHMKNVIIKDRSN